MLMSIDGKNQFSWRAHIGPKPRNSQPCYFSNVGVLLLVVVFNSAAVRRLRQWSVIQNCVRERGFKLVAASIILRTKNVSKKISPTIVQN